MSASTVAAIVQDEVGQLRDVLNRSEAYLSAQQDAGLQERFQRILALDPQVIETGHPNAPINVAVARLFGCDVLAVGVAVLPLLVDGHRAGQESLSVLFDEDDDDAMPGSVLPFLHVFNAMLLTLQLPGGIAATEAFSRETTPELLGVLSSSSALPLSSGSGTGAAAPAVDTADTGGEDPATVGETILEHVAEPFDYALKEVALGSSGGSSSSIVSNRLTCQAMWRVLCVCLHTNALPGSVFLELCNNDVRFPIAVAQLVLRMEPGIAKSIADLWIAKENLAAADAVAKKRQTRAADETGALHDVYEFKRRLSLAFVDEELLDKMLRVSEALFSEAYEEDLYEDEGDLMGIMTYEQTLGAGVDHVGGGGSSSSTQTRAAKKAGPKLRSEEFRVVFGSLCRCVTEMCAIVTDPRYAIWASARHRTFFGRLKRHLQLYGKSVADFVHVKVFFSGKLSAWDAVFAETVDALLALKLLDPGIVMESALLPEDLFLESRSVLFSPTPRAWPVEVDRFALNVRIRPGGEDETTFIPPSPQDLVLYAKLVLLSASVASDDLLHVSDPRREDLEVEQGLALAQQEQELHQQQLFEGVLQPAAAVVVFDEAGNNLLEAGQQEAVLGPFWRAAVAWLGQFFAYRKKESAAAYWSGLQLGGVPCGQAPGGAAEQHLLNIAPVVDERPIEAVHAPPGLSSGDNSLAFYEQQQRYRAAPEQFVAEQGSPAAARPNRRAKPPEHVGSLLAAEQDGLNHVNQQQGVAETNGNALKTKNNYALRAADADAVPEHWRCHIDGKLMAAPVRFVSPTDGSVHYYELATLQAWSAVHGDVCPITGEAFNANSLQRDTALEEEIRAATGVSSSAPAAAPAPAPAPS
eukprot:g3786.t1